MEMNEACDKLVEFMEEQEHRLVSPGWPIEMFCSHILKGETPRMALALAKKDLEDSYKS